MCFDTEPALVRFRLSLIDEEFGELETAHSQRNVIEIADALCDLSYVTHGTGHCLGLDLTATYPANQRDAVLLDNQAVLLDNQAILLDNQTATYIEQQISGLKHAIRQLHCHVDHKDLGQTHRQLYQILGQIYEFGHGLGFPMDLLFREVHRSNMTKAARTLEDAIASVEFYQNEQKYPEPAYKVQGGLYVIYDAQTSKILKNHRWELPRLDQLVDAQHIAMQIYGAK